ncbi:MAG: hypothetical protein Q7T93_13315 [Methylobacterium sp.]|uniref:hypothetical protein n=1 Tax=Methylobacterium sp. TaxID=409 RepID=UPI002721DE1C|nr:hypothetical protein [Methylobacterium sp.]MDO9427796.1 hypothetical protein [Methylobacterium sp.]
MTAPEVDANFQNLVDAIQALATQGVAGLGLLEFDPDTGVVTVLASNDAVVGRFQLPSRPVRPRGTWVLGVPYVLGDLVRVEPSDTVVRGFVGFVPGAYTSDAADPAADITQGRLLPLAYDGKPAQTPRGTYSELVTYVPGDVVTTGAGEMFQLFDAVPAGSTPGAPVIDASGNLVLKDGDLWFPWGQITLVAMEPIHFGGLVKPPINTLLFRRMVSRVGYLGPNMRGDDGLQRLQGQVHGRPHRRGRSQSCGGRHRCRQRDVRRGKQSGDLRDAGRQPALPEHGKRHHPHHRRHAGHHLRGRDRLRRDVLRPPYVRSGLRVTKRGFPVTDP